MCIWTVLLAVKLRAGVRRVRKEKTYARYVRGAFLSEYSVNSALENNSRSLLSSFAKFTQVFRIWNKLFQNVI